MYRQTLALKEKVLGPEHSDMLTSMSNLELVLSRQGRAELTFTRALEGKEEMVLPKMDVEGGSELPVVEPQVNGDYSATSTHQGVSSFGVSQSETLVEEEDVSKQEKTGMIDGMHDDDPLDISSVSSHVTTAREKDGKIHIGYSLARNPELRTLCSGVMDKLDKAEFANIGRRLLKIFYLGLLGDAQTEIQIQSVRLLKSRRGRERISKMIADTIIAADCQIFE
jgi:hypothetical protein